MTELRYIELSERALMDRNSEHDVVIRIDGNWPDDEARAVYLLKLKDALNATRAPGNGDPVGKAEDYKVLSPQLKYLESGDLVEIAVWHAGSGKWKTIILSKKFEIPLLFDCLSLARGDYVKVEDCPDCDNSGIRRDSSGEPEPCEWCYRMPNSRFNLQDFLGQALKGEAK